MQPARLGAARFCVAIAALFAVLVIASPVHAQEPAGTPEQANDRIRALSAASAARAAPPTDYIVGNGDLLAILVFDVPDLSRDVRVSQTGTIGIPLLPVRLHVAGLTESQIERKIEEVLEANGLIAHPEVSVSVKERKSKPITVVGAVSHPLVYQADRQVTLLEVLAEAGGIANDAGDTVIISRQPQPDPNAPSDEPPAIGPEDAIPNTPPDATSRPAASASPAASPAQNSSSVAAPPADATSTAGQVPPAIAPPPTPNTVTVNLGQLLETGDVKNNILLQPGDVVTVPHGGIIYVLGAVSKPGGFVVSNDRAQLTALKVLSLAGGLNRTARSDRAVIVRRDESGQQHEVAIDLDKVLKFRAEDVRLDPSDILYVPNSGAKAALLRAAEFGVAIGTGVALYRLAYR